MKEATGLTDNAGDLVAMAVCGYVSQPSLRPGGYLHYPDGKGVMLPGMFGVTYNASVGDRAFGWAGDHVEPGVSIANPNESADFALHYLTCIGNEATVMSGLTKGAKGIVTGEHARLLVAFEDEVNEMLNIGDQIQIMAHGRGIALSEFPSIEFKKTSPRLLNAMRLSRAGNGALKVPVAMELPIEIMGSGAELNSEYVDQDLMSGDRPLMADLGIDQMRLGDLIAIRHADHHFGRSYRKGSVSIALCIHGDSVMTGHGPGILTLMTCTDDSIDFEIDRTANIANYFSIGVRS
ncbi:DUF4438 domain-containing protein [Pelagibacterium lentulum]|uniref:DUF4438 domain-containing protein n=1 Tax=Pelagibacterium lentulum TaxID=2029865 RepID=A0A916W011_9HYPH|nr:DUF4438 domain-containing protein [Pelagibacterium lentulum]GGA55310.1 DUF4438 domain-containing protein [Pelagibacterium lentulum]